MGDPFTCRAALAAAVHAHGAGNAPADRNQHEHAEANRSRKRAPSCRRRGRTRILLRRAGFDAIKRSALSRGGVVGSLSGCGRAATCCGRRNWVVGVRTDSILCAGWIAWRLSIESARSWFKSNPADAFEVHLRPRMGVFGAHSIHLAVERSRLKPNRETGRHAERSSHQAECARELLTETATFRGEEPHSCVIVVGQVDGGVVFEIVAEIILNRECFVVLRGLVSGDVGRDLPHNRGQIFWYQKVSRHAGLLRVDAW